MCDTSTFIFLKLKQICVYNLWLVRDGGRGIIRNTSTFIFL